MHKVVKGVEEGSNKGSSSSAKHKWREIEVGKGHTPHPNSRAERKKTRAPPQKVPQTTPISQGKIWSIWAPGPRYFRAVNYTPFLHAYHTHTQTHVDAY